MFWKKKEKKDSLSEFNRIITKTNKNLKEVKEINDTLNAQAMSFLTTSSELLAQRR